MKVVYTIGERKNERKVGKLRNEWEANRLPKWNERKKGQLIRLVSDNCLCQWFLLSWLFLFRPKIFSRYFVIRYTSYSIFLLLLFCVIFQFWKLLGRNKCDYEVSCAIYSFMIIFLGIFFSTIWHSIVSKV